MIHKSLPNILSLLRILMTPLFVVFMLQDEPYYLLISFLLVFIISITDFFDGYYARKYNLVTELGKYLDPIADKVFILVVLFTFHFFLGSKIFPVWMILLILLRDVVVTVLRNIFKAKDMQFVTSRIAKNKTLFQVICMHIIMLVIIVNRYSIMTINYDFIYYLMFCCTLVTLFSGFDYILQYFYKNKKI